MKVVQTIKQFFESEPHGRKVSMDEMKELSKEERLELATMASEEMGTELEVSEK